MCACVDEEESLEIMAREALAVKDGVGVGG
jgi:hypothetical protein